MRQLIDPRRRDKIRAEAEQVRRANGAPHRVEYFHQPDDPYSHLAAQVLAALGRTYNIEIVPWLVRPPEHINASEPALLAAYGHRDARAIAQHYGLEFPDGPTVPDTHLVSLAGGILAATGPGDFAARAFRVGQALWTADSAALRTLADTHGTASVTSAMGAGSDRRATLGHYSGAMFYYAGEWYWGVDRLYHLEARLRDLGALRHDDAEPVAPRPAIETGPIEAAGGLTLEIYVSLRSPYTSIIFDAAVAMAERAGVAVEVRPVLPMVMRGVGLSRTKGTYIFLDAKREAETLGVDFCSFADPIGRPVERVYSLFSWAADEGRGPAFVSSFLKAVFVEGVNTNRDRGLKHVVEKAGLSWSQARNIVDNDAWQAALETNRLQMYAVNQWGVPCFCLKGPEGTEDLNVWGQDRLWLVAREIKERIEGMQG